jgi:thiol:disulfide interchange protein
MIRSTLLSFVCLAFLVTSSAPAQEINWRTEYAAALKESETTRRPLFVDVYGPNCFFCRQLDASTFRDPTVVSTLNEKFVPLKIDGNQNMWLVNALGITRYPTIVISAPDGTIRTSRTGFIDSATMQAELRRILDDLPPVVAQSTTP